MQPSPSRTLASVRQAVFLISMPFFVLGPMLWAFQAVSYAASDPAEQALVADLTGCPAT